jgi:hypothetical protein
MSLTTASRTFVTAVGLALLLLPGAGCTGRRCCDYSQLQLVQVSGVVTLDGRPLAQASVLFEAEDGTSSRGTTDASGVYRLLYNAEKSGVTPGPKIVRISSRRDAFTEAAAPTEEARAAGAARPEVVPARYNVRSELRVVVGASRQTFDFDLRDGVDARGAAS